MRVGAVEKRFSPLSGDSLAQNLFPYLKMRHAAPTAAQCAEYLDAINRPRRIRSGKVTKVKGGDMRACGWCGQTKTPMWRSGPKEVTFLCNACGLQFKKKVSAMQDVSDGLFAGSFGTTRMAGNAFAVQTPTILGESSISPDQHADCVPTSTD